MGMHHTVAKRGRAARGLSALAALGTLGAATLLSGCYVTAQGSRYLALRAKARPLEKVLADPATKPELRALVETAARVRVFATAELGLAETKNFRSLVVLDSDRLATVVQACAELSFDRHLWSYPLVGKLPYKGFFDPAEAEKEAAARRAEGLDVIVRPVDAFSTLGWFSDPLFSFMAGYDEADLAELVIHELCHATAFAKGAEDWNEELATFVGREGAARYLAAREGPDSPSLAAARLSRREAEAFAAWLRGTAAALEPVYAAADPPERKRERKAAVIAERAAAFEREYGNSFETERYRGFPMARLNNAYLDLYRLYEGESGLYRDYFEKAAGGDLRRFVADMAALAGTKEKGGPKEAMRRALAGR
ncbi:MAG: aminopeptidase [Spirochaetaceae bacterium]|nr:aminopeptidase [Spirochaetaceae bacterium]